MPGAIAAKLGEVLPELHWVADYPHHPVLRGNFGHAVIAELAGIVIGCNLLAARTEYPAHAHAAQEIYVPLSDSAALFWQESTGQFEPGSPGDIIVHGSQEAHAITTQEHPVLNVWLQFGQEPGGPALFS